MTPRFRSAEGEQGEEAEPEGGHGVPVPRGAVDQYLTVFDALECDETDNGSGQAKNTRDEMDGVGPSEDVKGVASIAAGLEAESLERELMPC